MKDAHSSCPICRATYEDGDTVRERENVEGEDGIDAMGELHLPVEEESNAMLAASGQLSGPGTSPMVTECTETNTDINDCVSITLGTDTDAIQPQIAQMA